MLIPREGLEKELLTTRDINCMEYTFEAHPHKSFKGNNLYKRFDLETTQNFVTGSKEQYGVESANFIKSNDSWIKATIVTFNQQTETIFYINTE